MKKSADIPPAALEALRSSEAAAKAAAKQEQPTASKTIRLRLTRARWEKLVAFADAEGLRIEQVLWRFIDACQPGGGDKPWVSPADRARARERAAGE